jgi:putative addiction module component (TIGR02574 family)
MPRMTHETEQLLQKALSLPDSERAELAGNLIASLDTNIDPDVDAAWQEEVARRWDEVCSGKVSTIPWESVQRKARTLLDGK